MDVQSHPGLRYIIYFIALTNLVFHENFHIDFFYYMYMYVASNTNDMNSWSPTICL